MNIFFRVDSSNIIGTGHLIRCLKLAKYFNNHNIFFICKNFQGNLNRKINESGFKLFELKINNDNSILNNSNTWLGENYKNDANKTITILNKYKADILIVDNYAIDFKWEELLKPHVKKMLVIDDFVERKHNCEYILNGIEEDEDKYNKLCNKDCKLLLGPKYFIISKEFFELSPKKTFNDLIKRIFVFISGSDIDNYTYKIMKHLEGKFENIQFDILVGASNINKNLIKKMCDKNSNYNYYYNINNVYYIMFKADLCIGSLGQNFIERMIFGIPSIVFTIADNQLGFLEKYKDKELFVYVGHKISKIEIIEYQIKRLVSDEYLLNRLLENNKSLSNTFKNNNINNIINLVI
jgi:UDP-2,4-diacetamido-2,4,6-trideoxy-beta-L-altropyranose hydrolase